MATNNATGRAYNFKDLTGQTFERLTVIGLAGKIGKNLAWQCKCACGNTIVAAGKHLVSGNIRSCKCLAKDRTRERSTKHGMAGSKIYCTWRSMMRRCYDVSTKDFERYGGRGIVVCERWHKFENFLIDLDNLPGEGDSIDRIENDGPYSPSNCQWASAKTQQRNSRKNRLLTCFGKTQCLAAWAEEYGMIVQTLRQRLERGLNASDALTKPVQRYRKIERLTDGPAIQT